MGVQQAACKVTLSSRPQDTNSASHSRVQCSLGNGKSSKGSCWQKEQEKSLALPSPAVVSGLLSLSDSKEPQHRCATFPYPHPFHWWGHRVLAPPSYLSFCSRSSLPVIYAPGRKMGCSEVVPLGSCADFHCELNLYLIWMYSWTLTSSGINFVGKQYVDSLTIWPEWSF